MERKMILLGANDINARIFGAVFSIVVIIIIIIIKSILDKQKQNREKQIISYADRKGLKYIQKSCRDIPPEIRSNLCTVPAETQVLPRSCLRPPLPC